jgi:hypothetical protein
MSLNCAEVVGKKRYAKADFISFQSRYKGKLKNGYFVNEISVLQFDPQYQVYLSQKHHLLVLI